MASVGAEVPEPQQPTMLKIDLNNFIDFVDISNCISTMLKIDLNNFIDFVDIGVFAAQCTSGPNKVVYPIPLNNC